jgi:uncharacterized membrane protein required for colicin V production
MMIDILCFGAAVYGFMMGFRGGFVNTLFRVFSIFFALMAAFKFSPYVSDVLSTGFEINGPLMFIASFILTFFLSMWLMRWLGSMLTAGMEMISVNLPNQIVGGVVLGFLFVVIYSIGIWFADGAGMIEAATKAQSRTMPLLAPLPEKTFAVIGDLKPTFQKFFKKTNEVMDDVERTRVQRKETKSDIYDINEEKPKDTPPQ